MPGPVFFPMIERDPAKARRSALLRLSAACGVLAPVIYALVIFVLGLLTPGYSQITQLMSELGETGAPFALVMNLGGFLLLGILLIAFSFGLYASLPPSRAGCAGAVLVMIAGLTYAGEATFSCDIGCLAVTTAGSLHLLIGEIAVIVAILASFALAIAMRKDPRWKGYWQCSLATGVLVILLLSLFTVFPTGQGAVQRLVVGVILLWMLAIARQAYRILSG